MKNIQTLKEMKTVLVLLSIFDRYRR